jgi:glycosyltransferase involved in cell wall biosynthesis
MARALQSTYNSKKKPEVIYNSFPSEFTTERFGICSNEQICQIIWTSRTVGPGRGLETLLKILNQVSESFDLHIIGNCIPGYKHFLLNNFSKSLNHKLMIHDFMTHSELQNIIDKCDIGLAIENKLPYNKDVTVSNKILQYLQSGLRVLATDTEGQKEISDLCPKSVRIVSSHNYKKWPETIDYLIRNRRAFVKNEEKYIYDNYLSWDKQEKKLIKLINEHL